MHLGKDTTINCQVIFVLYFILPSLASADQLSAMLIRMPILLFFLLFCMLYANKIFTRDKIAKNVVKFSLHMLMIILIIVHFCITGIDAYYVPIIFQKLNLGFCETSTYTPLIGIFSILIYVISITQKSIFTKNDHFLILIIGGLYSIGFVSQQTGIEICITTILIGIISIILNNNININICMKFILVNIIFYIALSEFTLSGALYKFCSLSMIVYFILWPIMLKLSNITSNEHLKIYTLLATISSITLSGISIKIIELLQIDGNIKYNVAIGGISATIFFINVLYETNFSRALILSTLMTFFIFITNINNTSSYIKEMYLITTSQALIMLIIALNIHTALFEKYKNIPKLLLCLVYIITIPFLITKIDIANVNTAIPSLISIVIISIAYIKLCTISDNRNTEETEISHNSINTAILMVTSLFVISLNFYYHRNAIKEFIFHITTSILLLLITRKILIQKIIRYNQSASNTINILTLIVEKIAMSMIFVYNNSILYISAIFHNSFLEFKKNLHILLHAVEDFDKLSTKKYSRNDTMIYIVCFLGFVLSVKIFM